jgi:hypothetical protein
VAIIALIVVAVWLGIALIVLAFCHAANRNSKREDDGAGSRPTVAVTSSAEANGTRDRRSSRE